MRARLLPMLSTLVLSLWTCFAAGAAPLSVTFINPGGSTEFWGDVSATMRAAAQDLDIELEVIDTNRNRLDMVQAARSLAQRARLPDYVVIVNELQQAPIMLDALTGTGVAVFELLNRMTEEQRAARAASGPDSPRLVGSIVPDNRIAGYDMAVSVMHAARTAGLADDGLQVLALLGDAATPAALAREAGLMQALDDAPDARLVRAIPVMWDSETAYERTKAVLARYDIDAVWAANDQIALGAQRAAIEAGEVPGQTMAFAGLNWSDAGLAAVRDGTMTMTHGGHFFAGAWSMVMIRDMADGRLAMDTDLTFPMSAVEPDTVDQFLELFAARDWTTIDFEAFQRRNADAEGYRFTADAILGAAQQSRLAAQ